MPLRLESAGLTDVGRKRGHNEDALFLDRENNLFIVADGMGGHASGEVASQLAVETLFQFFQETGKDKNRTWPYKMDKSYSFEENRLMVGVKLANKQIFGRAQMDLRLKGMGTTLVSTFFQGNRVLIGHVGDSRVYVIRGSEISQLTEDHSLLNDYMKIKKLTPEEIKNFPHKNVIVRALGMKDLVQVDLLSSETQPGDIYLLCSDGLSGLVEDPELNQIVQEHKNDLNTACQKLIDEANRNGGNDNITVVLIKVLDTP
ncbi:MAG TPA: Stp1/IreP family PP2C-type Ser/Thr phosphatase [Myxococcales bacterium]|nr:serine/threonine protein phosphatase [Deltaproteobacteria bacterium]MBU53780.1 serine/threonine protein phosphatase [Deltaproteobacteria bacterium]HAA57540.1 Stp1/IreP family PP2C-type Ser/Thr phosphatase [Myxococcales bacterium]|tara:strand:+ start:6411 stop:7187 length:777 start_codon:yes stop_codon:yes gene_type:complete